jgi:hypothetical protein
LQENYKNCALGVFAEGVIFIPIFEKISKISSRLTHPHIRRGDLGKPTYFLYVKESKLNFSAHSIENINSLHYKHPFVNVVYFEDHKNFNRKCVNTVYTH